MNQQNAGILVSGMQNKSAAEKSRIMIIPSSPFSYPLLFEIEGGGGPFVYNDDERDPDDMTDYAYRSWRRERGEI